jgi:hypothetical protein
MIRSQATCALVLATALVSWHGKTIEVRASSEAILNTSDDHAAVLADTHRILVREEAITVDGVAKPVTGFSRVLIDVQAAGTVNVTVDGKPLFP